MDFACKYPNGLRHYKQIFQDRHRKRWKIGDWTDDTNMMLCIADAIMEDKGVNFLNIAKISREIHFCKISHTKKFVLSMILRIFVVSVLAKPLNNAQIVRGVFCLYTIEHGKPYPSSG